MSKNTNIKIKIIEQTMSEIEQDLRVIAAQTMEMREVMDELKKQKQEDWPYVEHGIRQP